MLNKAQKMKSIDEGSRVKAGKLKSTPETRLYILLLLALVFYILASNIGSGWVLFLSAATICSCLLSVLIPALVLRSISLEIHAAETAVAGESIPLHVRIYLPEGLKFLAKFMLLNTVPTTKSRFANAEKTEAKILIPALKDGMIIETSSAGLKRGIRQISPVQIESSYPFGLIWTSAIYASKKTIAVLPQTEPVEGSFLYRLSSSVYVPGGNKISKQGFQSASARGVRHYVRGDSRRHIHWNLSARHGQLMVKELEHEGLASFDIVFDLGAKWQNEEQFELAITAVASLLKLGHSLGIHPDLFIPEKALAENERLGSPLSQDIDQQLLSLAALDFENSGAKCPDGLTQSSKKAFSTRQKALVLVCPELPGQQSEEVQEKSRSSVFLLSVASEPNAANHGTEIGAGFILHNKEALHTL